MILLHHAANSVELINNEVSSITMAKPKLARTQ